MIPNPFVNFNFNVAHVKIQITFSNLKQTNQQTNYQQQQQHYFIVLHCINQLFL